MNNNHKIIVVDAEKAVRDFFDASLSHAGYAVRLAESSEQAMEVLRQENIQVMFLGLNLKEMSGLALCRRIRNDFPLAIIHAVTARASFFELADCRGAGFDEYLTRSVDSSALLQAAKKAFEKIHGQ